MTRATTSLALCLAAGAARADGVAFWLWDVTTQDGDGVVEPGETASVTLSLLFEPNPADALYATLSATIFDVLGDDGAAGGQILGWEVHNHLAELTGDLTTTDGVSLYNINAGQLPGFGPFTDANPIDVLTFEWQPLEYAPLTAGYTTCSDLQSEPIVVAWEWNEGPYMDSIAVNYPVVEAAIGFDVVPAPAGATVALLTGLALRRRRPS